MKNFNQKINQAIRIQNQAEEMVNSGEMSSEKYLRRYRDLIVMTISEHANVGDEVMVNDFGRGVIEEKKYRSYGSSDYLIRFDHEIVPGYTSCWTDAWQIMYGYTLERNQ